MADPGFSRGGAASPRRGGGGFQHMILQNFPKNCMKLKEFGPRARPLRPPLDPPLIKLVGLHSYKTYPIYYASKDKNFKI